MENHKKSQIKVPKTTEEQIQILKDRELVIEDEGYAKEVISKINYYRFSAYTLTLKKNDMFYKDTTFEHIYGLYEFDRKLRLELLSVLEQIEIQARTKISYHLAHKHGPTPHLNPDIFKNKIYFKKMKCLIEREIDRSKELFISHHKKRYNSVFPIWVAIEVTSFSLLSQMYSNLNDDDQKIIAQSFNNNKEYIKNWFYSLSVLRNRCAHFGRLYNRKLDIHIKLAKKDRQRSINESTIFSAIFVMCKILKDKNTSKELIKNISILLDKYKQVDISELGFPINWIEILEEI